MKTIIATFFTFLIFTHVHAGFLSQYKAAFQPEDQPFILEIITLGGDLFDTSSKISSIKIYAINHIPFVDLFILDRPDQLEKFEITRTDKRFEFAGGSFLTVYPDQQGYFNWNMDRAIAPDDTFLIYGIINKNEYYGEFRVDSESMDEMCISTQDLIRVDAPTVIKPPVIQ